jgi:hypothetical protein
MTLFSRLFSLCPRIGKCGASLVAGTAWRLRLVTLGLLHRQVFVDPKEQEIRIQRRYGWFFRRQQCIRFRAVQAITYGHQNWGPGALLAWAHESVDLSSTGLRLHGGEEVPLFSFFGDATLRTESSAPDWYYWEDYLIDVRGTKERESRVFVGVLSRMIRVPIAPSRT